MSGASISGSRRRILVVGCGAIGGIFAAYLSRVAEVVALDADRAHVDAIQTNGLTIEGEHGFVAEVEATADPAALGDAAFDAILLLVKSAQTAAALQALGAATHRAGLLVTLQNGMGNAEQLLATAGGAVARGVTMDAGRYVGPGRIAHLIRANNTWLGPVRGAEDDCGWLAALLTEAGLHCRVTPEPMDAVWSKFVFNAVMNPIGALLLGVNAARYRSPEVMALIDDMALECTRVVEALGGRFAFDPMEMVKATRAGQRPVTRHAGSMALDIGRGVATEIDELTGFVVREGRRLGIGVPCCETVVRLVKGLEVARAWQIAEAAASVQANNQTETR